MSKKTYQELIGKNREWVVAQLAKDPSFFENLSKGQDPSFLCIGCSDSRLPINVLTQRVRLQSVRKGVFDHCTWKIKAFLASR